MAKLAQESSSLQNSELRKHYFQERFVIIAPKRNLRPDTFSKKASPHLAPVEHCPFDHNNEHAVWEQPRNGEWRVKVVRNAFPALSQDNPAAFGIQEVIINTPDHNTEFSGLSLSHITEIFSAYRHRLIELSKIEGIRYVLIFKNDGPVAGASVAHAHCQIIALPIVPPHIETESDALNHYWDEKDSCAYCDIIAWESSQKVRIIAADKNFIALSPYASSHAFEAWLIPRRHINKFTELHSDEIHSLATIMKSMTSRLDSFLISFNYFLQESLDNQDHHFVLKIEPRTTEYAGAEMGTGVIINPVTPEYATLWYRGKITASPKS
jgi:UDPglucose--hexose-1-phosphate uridylyltransferase